MISRISLKFGSRLYNKLSFCFTESSGKTPIIFGNGKSLFSLSQWWSGSPPRPFDYYVQDSLKSQITSGWTLQDGFFRVLFPANICDGSMNININQLKNSESLNQLIQLSASQKEKLVENPSTVIIKSIIEENLDVREDQLARNILELDKLFQEGVGLKTSYLIDGCSLKSVQYIEQLKRRNKAISADVTLTGASFEQTIFNQGYKLEHILLDGVPGGPAGPNSASPFKYNYDLKAVLAVLAVIDFKGKIVLPGGQHYLPSLQLFTAAAKETGFTPKLEYELQTDGWYTML